jgi:hypothetical protein
MKNEILGIIAILVVTIALLALRHLILNVGKRGRNLSTANDRRPAARSLRVVRADEEGAIEIDDEERAKTPREKRAVEQIDPRWFPRFPV